MAVQMHTPFILADKFEKLTISSYVPEKTMSLPSTPSTPTSPAPEDYDIRILKEDDTETVLEHLRKFFFRDEPLNIATKLVEFEDSTCTELEEFSTKGIHEGTSLVAVTKSGKIIGVCLNGTINRDDPEEEFEGCPNTKFAKILRLLIAVGNEGKQLTTKLYPDVEKIISVKILSTDTAWRGKGIAKELMNRTRNIGRDQGYGLMRVDCSNCYSARAISRLGFEQIYELKYSDWIENGQQVFDTEQPHNEMKIYVQRILPST